MRTQLLLAALLFAPFARAEPGEEPGTPKPPAFKAPKGWKSEKAGKFVSARFRVGEGGDCVIVTVIGLKGEWGGITANVNRWRSQVGLGQLDDDGAKKALRSVKVGGIDGHFLDVSGTGKDDKQPQAVLVTFVKRGEHTWFFRMVGPADKVKGQRGQFDAFLKSVRFEATEKKR